MDEIKVANITGGGKIIIGDNSSNTLIGSEKDDRIKGLKGQDTLRGLGGDDTQGKRMNQ